MNRSGLLSRRFIGSEEFTIAYVASLTLVVAGSSLLICYYYLTEGNLVVGCTIGVLGLAVSAICFWKLASALRRAHTRYHPGRIVGRR